MKLDEQGNTKVYIKIEKTYPITRATLEKGLLGPITSRNTRYVFGQLPKARFEEIGQVDIVSGKLLDTNSYGPENTRDAQIVLSAFLNS